MAAADRAINLPLRVQGIGEAERDLKRVGRAGEEGFERVEKAANGANQEVSEYTARLKRAAAAAKGAFDRSPDVQAARILDPAGYRPAKNDFVKEAVELEQHLIREGLPESTQMWDDYGQAVDGAGGSLGRTAAIAAVAAAALAAAINISAASIEAFIEHERALDAFHAALSLAGNQSGATGDQIAAMAEQVVAATGQTEQSALQAAQVLATVPGLTREGLAEALEVAAQLADVLDKDVTQTAEDVGAVLSALADEDIKGLFSATEELRPSLRKAIIDLAETGSTAAAQKVYFDALRTAIGDGPNGLTTSADGLTNSWNAFKRSLGEDLSGPAGAFTDIVGGALDQIRLKAEATNRSILSVLTTAVTNPTKYALLPTARPKGRDFIGSAIGTGLSKVRELSQQASAAYERIAARDLAKRFGKPPKSKTGGKRSGGGRRAGKSDAQRTAEKLKREADQARKSADRVVESNEDVIASYRLRAAESEAKIGLEGAALEAVVRAQSIDAAARRINTDLIEKEVDARRAAAAAAGQQFDAAQATADATAQVQRQQGEVRTLAARYVDAEQAIANFNRRQAEAKSIIEQTRTPMERLNQEVEAAVKALRAGDIEADTFNRRMDQLAVSMAEVAHETDRAAQAWEGFGNDVGRTFSDIILNGGSARDILQELIRLPLERLLFQNVETPIANLIDGFTGNNQDKNIAAARSQLPTSADAAAGALGAVGAQGYAAAQALSVIATGLQNPLAELDYQTGAAADGLGELVPLTGQYAGALGQAISALSGGGASGGGLLGTVFKLAGAVAAGGGTGPSAALAPDVSATMAANPGLFASGTDRLPVGKPFYVGENGRELMELTRGGGMRVYSNQEERRLAPSGGGTSIVQHITIPERADPRRTASGIARSTQGALGRAGRKGLAIAGSAI